MSRRRLLLICSGALVLVALGVVGAYVLVKLRASEDVRGSSTREFVTTAAPPEKPKPPPPGVAWPTWGYENVRTRVSPYAHRPPFRAQWSFRAGSLLEFPPAVAYGLLFVTNNDGVTYAIDATTGKLAWRHRSGRCAASTPAVEDGTLVQAFLNVPPCNSDRSPEELEGRVIALDARTGKVRWRARLGPTESSPLVSGGRVYVGDWRGDVHAFALRTGERRWTFRTGGRVKGALALSGDQLFVGAYDGRVYSLNARTGAELWNTESQDRLGGRGQFYATPAVAYGRVYVGSTDGKVYSFGASSGDLIWSQSTGGYVYSSPAVWRQLVFAGSYSGRLYAFDAATGDVRWRAEVNGPISGAPTVMAGLVYVATLNERTFAFSARSGRLVWSFGDGKYTPLVADRDRPYLVGHTRIYALAARRPG
jgi:outer membrane protein assembly factor BamB